jgi:hypothetical protein
MADLRLQRRTKTRRTVNGSIAAMMAPLGIAISDRTSYKPSR